jgi:hypothetical protein
VEVRDHLDGCLDAWEGYNSPAPAGCLDVLEVVSPLLQLEGQLLHLPPVVVRTHLADGCLDVLEVVSPLLQLEGLLLHLPLVVVRTHLADGCLDVLEAVSLFLQLEGQLLQLPLVVVRTHLADGCLDVWRLYIFCSSWKVNYSTSFLWWSGLTLLMAAWMSWRAITLLLQLEGQLLYLPPVVVRTHLIDGCLDVLEGPARRSATSPPSCGGQDSPC